MVSLIASHMSNCLRARSNPRKVRHTSTTVAEELFEMAADAVIEGRLSELQALLRDQPALATARSQREHHATLLHYVAANGVEQYRQKSPPNAVEIANTLLEAGAEVDALADTYAGGTTETTLNLLVSSVHPREAGVQVPLVHTLLDHGAAVDGIANDCSPLVTALAFWYGSAADGAGRTRRARRYRRNRGRGGSARPGAGDGHRRRYRAR